MIEKYWPWMIVLIFGIAIPLAALVQSGFFPGPRCVEGHYEDYMQIYRSGAIRHETEFVCTDSEWQSADWGPFSNR